MKNIILFLFLFISFVGNAQPKKVLFIGNSYTAVNDLPQLVYDVALSAGDTLIYDSHTPGGARLVDHANSAIAQTKINSNNWDHVVLQAQSQEPSLSDNYVETEVYPFAEILCNSIRANDSCTRPIFYMTWGRQNGDASNCASWPPVCTYEGMDSLLNLRYRKMGADNESFVSPVGAVWHYIRDNYPDINLYVGDGSHPSIAGSYAAACTFYAIIFRKDPTLISLNASLTEADANAIKEVARIIVFEDLAQWNVGVFDPIAAFTMDQDGETITLTNNSNLSDAFYWEFGDGASSTDFEPVYEFQSNGTFTIKLIAEKCGITDTASVDISIQTVSLNNILEAQVRISPNPSTGLLEIQGIPQAVQIQLLNSKGEVLHSHSTSSPKSQVSLSDYPAGVYFISIELETGEARKVERVVKY